MTQPDVQVALGGRHRIQRHDERNDVAEQCGVSRAAHAERGEKPYAVDEEIVKNAVGQIGGDIRDHRNLGVADAALGGVDGHTHRGEQHTRHNNAEIRHCIVEDILVRAGERDQRLSDDNGRCAEHHAENQCDGDRLRKTFVRAVAVALPFPAADNGGDADIHGEKDGKEQKAAAGSSRRQPRWRPCRRWTPSVRPQRKRGRAAPTPASPATRPSAASDRR